jgi:hypothetical protein
VVVASIDVPAREKCTVVSPTVVWKALGKVLMIILALGPDKITSPVRSDQGVHGDDEDPSSKP